MGTTNVNHSGVLNLHHTGTVYQCLIDVGLMTRTLGVLCTRFAPPPHKFLPGFERIKKLVQNKRGGGPDPPIPPRGYAPGLPVVKQLANDSMMNTAMNVREACANDKGECGISLDGTWQRRGHVSHNGVVTAISLQTKKCLDVEILSDKCKACQKWNKKTNDPKYEEWKANHQCKINHVGSANGMEAAVLFRYLIDPQQPEAFSTLSCLVMVTLQHTTVLWRVSLMGKIVFQESWNALDTYRNELVADCTS